jgi:hypothetical protein
VFDLQPAFLPGVVPVTSQHRAGYSIFVEAVDFVMTLSVTFYGGKQPTDRSLEIAKAIELTDGPRHPQPVIGTKCARAVAFFAQALWRPPFQAFL